MMDISPDAIDALTAIRVSEYLIDGYSFFTDNGLVTIWPGHPQYTDAKRAYGRHMERLNKAWFKPKHKRKTR